MSSATAQRTQQSEPTQQSHSHSHPQFSTITPLSALKTLPDNTKIAFLAVVLSARVDARSVRKSDWYLVDGSLPHLPPSSPSAPPPPVRRRRTILSVWRDIAEFRPRPGDIVFVRGARVNRRYEEDTATQRLRKVGGEGAEWGLLNVYANARPDWWVAGERLEGMAVEGYAELVKWRDEVLTRELQQEAQWEEDVRMRNEKEIAEREEQEEQERYEAEEEMRRIGEVEMERRMRAEMEEFEERGLVWRMDGKAFWRVDGLYSLDDDNDHDEHSDA